MATGKRIQATNNTTQFQAKLTGTTKSIKLMLAGNYGDAFAEYAPSPGNSEDEVKANMGTPVPEYKVEDIPPMPEADDLPF